MLGGGFYDFAVADEVIGFVPAGALPAGLRGTVLLGDDLLQDVLPGARGQTGVAVPQIDLGDLQIHAGVKDSFILGVNNPLRLDLVTDAKTLPLVGLRVKTIISVADAAINQTITFHIAKRNRA